MLPSLPCQFLPIPEFLKLLFPRAKPLSNGAQMVPGILAQPQPLVAFETWRPQQVC